jgi:hypothetical protein
MPGNVSLDAAAGGGIEPGEEMLYPDELPKPAVIATTELNSVR